MDAGDISKCECLCVCMFIKLLLSCNNYWQDFNVSSLLVCLCPDTPWCQSASTWPLEVGSLFTKNNIIKCGLCVATCHLRLWRRQSSLGLTFKIQQTVHFTLYLNECVYVCKKTCESVFVFACVFTDFAVTHMNTLIYNDVRSCIEIKAPLIKIF